MEKIDGDVETLCFPCVRCDWVGSQVAERKGGIASNTFRGLHGAFIVADISRPDTFQSVSKFRQMIDEKVGPVDRWYARLRLCAPATLCDR